MNTLRRYVVFDMYSGYIFGEAYTPTPEGAVSLVHSEFSPDPADFEYVPRINCGLASYYVYDCTDLQGLSVDNGQDQDTIDLVSNGEFVGYYKRVNRSE